MGAAAAVSVGFLAMLSALAAVKVLPLAAMLATLLMSLIAVVLYRRDKSAALRGAWRTPEATLHMVSLMGGWPGALIAQRFYRHKISKRPFQIVFWCTVVANGALLAWLAFTKPFDF